MVHTETDRREGGAAGRSSNCSWPRRPTPPSWPPLPRGWASTSTPFPEGGRREVHPLRALRPGLQRDDGPRGDQPLRPGRIARGPHGLRRAKPAVPGLRGLRVHLPHGRRRPGHDHRAAAAAARHGLRQVPHRPALHRPGPSAGLAAGAGHRPRQLRPFHHRPVRPVRQGLPGPTPSTTISRPRNIELEVGAVVLTPGFEAFDATRRGEFGFGLAPNVLTSVQFERMLSASGPTQRPHPPARRRQGRRGGWPSSSASAPATPAATTTTARRSAAWPPPRRRSWPRSTSRAWTSPSSSSTCGPSARTSTATAIGPRTSWACATSAPSFPGPMKCPARGTCGSSMPAPT